METTQTQATMLGVVESEVKDNSRTQEVLRRLNPEVFVDDERNDRYVYTFRTKRGNDVRVIFFSPEELPFSKEVIDGKQGFILGDRPKWRRPDEWQGFVKDVQEHSIDKFSPLNTYPHLTMSSIEANHAMFFVESSPKSLLDLAFLLGVDHPELRNTRQNIANGVLTDYDNALIDQVIAAKVVEDSGQLRDEKGDEGDALFLLALQGDKDAQDLLNSKSERLHNMENANRREMLDQLRQKAETINEEPLKLDELVAVHLTRFLPKRTESGEIPMTSTFDGTGWQNPRNTIHFALNHPVAAHMYGSWADAPYAVIAPLQKLIERSGNPAVLNTVDTFYEITPGQKLMLPQETIIVRPGEVEKGNIYQDSGEHDVLYKSKNIEPTDVATLTASFGDHEQYWFNQEIWRAVTDDISYGAGFGDYSRSVITREEHELLVEHLGGVLQPANLLERLKKEKPEDLLNDVYKQTDLDRKIPMHAREQIKTNIESILISKIKEVAIKTRLEALGYENMPDGMWAWGDSWKVTFQTFKLGTELGVPTVAHSNHISHDLEAGLRGELGRGPGLLTLFLSGKITPKEYRDRAHRFAMELFPKISPASKRMLFLMGLI